MASRLRRTQKEALERLASRGDWSAPKDAGCKLGQCRRLVYHGALVSMFEKLRYSFRITDYGEYLLATWRDPGIKPTALDKLSSPEQQQRLIDVMAAQQEERGRDPFLDEIAAAARGKRRDVKERLLEMRNVGLIRMRVMPEDMNRGRCWAERISCRLERRAMGMVRKSRGEGE